MDLMSPDILKPWMDKNTVRNSAVFIYLIHTQLPAFMQMEMHTGNRFRTPEALKASIDMTGGFILKAITAPEPPVSIRQVLKLHQNHGIPSEWMEFIAGIITIAPSIVSPERTPYATTDHRLHAHISTRFADGFGITLPPQELLEGNLQSFYFTHRGETSTGTSAQATLTQTYPEQYAEVLASAGYRSFAGIDR